MFSATSSPPTSLFDQVCQFDNLFSAWRKAARGKRSSRAAAAFELGVADRLLELQTALKTECYRPGDYTHFTINEPKRRLISAAPFRDRVVHHALCNLIEPLFEAHFIPDSYANRAGKGTHRAVARCQHLARGYRYVLRMDIVKHFPSIDHQILLDSLRCVVTDQRVLALAGVILDSGDGIADQDYQRMFFPGDDLLAACRPQGLPIGNLTSQFWSNCYLHPLDLFVKRELGCRAYVRYVDDFALFSNSKRQLWEWRGAVIERLQRLRLRIHEPEAQAMPTRCGMPWLGFVVYPDHRRVKSRKVVQGTRRLSAQFEAWRQGRISFAEFDAGVQGWINHVRYADSWGLREHVLSRYVW